jgi:hypothetical protein
MQFKDTIVGALGPVWDLVEPFKVYEGKIERGVPATHNSLDCGATPEEVQCKHKVMASSPMVGAGHHVRAKTNVPVIGILT